MRKGVRSVLPGSTVPYVTGLGMAPHEIGLPPGLPLDQAGLGPPFMGLGPPGLLQPPLMPGPPANILIRHLGMSNTSE
jgi:hypothetical protein